MFQGMFAIITPALISGAIVERMRFRGYIVFLILWATLIYDPLAHWVWGSGGWLLKRGALDFAGGTVVHISAGVSALVAAWYLGPRRDYRRVPIAPRSEEHTSELQSHVNLVCRLLLEKKQKNKNKKINKKKKKKKKKKIKKQY